MAGLDRKEVGLLWQVLGDLKASVGRSTQDASAGDGGPQSAAVVSRPASFDPGKDVVE